jgi:hypothetical protein
MGASMYAKRVDDPISTDWPEAAPGDGRSGLPAGEIQGPTHRREVR